MSPEDNDTAGQHFPIWRALVAMAVVSVLTPMIYLLRAGFYAKPSLYELAVLPLDGFVFAWPVCIIFVALGFPTLYTLFRLHRTGFGLFVSFGVLYTALGAALLYVSGGGRRTRELMYYSVVFGLIGLVNGVITRLIVCGWRSKSAEKQV